MALFSTSVQLLEYADDIDIIGSTMRAVTAAFSAIARESTKMGLALNEGKTKYMLSTNRDVPRMGSQITPNGYNFVSLYTLAPPLTRTTTSAWKSSAE